MPAKNMPGRKAGEDHARTQCPEKRPGTQGPLRGEAFVDSTLSLAAISGPLFLSVQRIFRSQSPSVASLCFAKASLLTQASSGCAGQKSR